MANHKKYILSDKTLSTFIEEKTKPFAREYLTDIRENWRKLEKNLCRLLIFLVLLIVAFELLKKSAIGEISFGSIKLSDLSFAYKIIPILISYSFYSLCNITLTFKTYRIIHESVLRAIYPELIKNDIEKFYVPPYLTIFGDITFSPKHFSLYKLFDFLQARFVLTVIFGSLLFEIYAFINLFNLYGREDVYTWISLVISLFFILMGLLVVIAHNDVEKKYY